METLADTVYPTEWPGFPGENGARQQARADLRVVSERFDAPVLPADALVVNEVLKAEQAAAFREADSSPIYDYEIEMQRPVPPLNRVAERVSWRQRTKRLMHRASDAFRDVSISAFTTAQVKAEQLKNYYSDESAGGKRKKVTAAVVGTLALGAAAYLGSKGVAPSGSSHRHVAETGSVIEPKAAHHHMVTVHDGQNPWTISEQHLRQQGNSHPSTAQIASYDRKMARANPEVYTYGDDSAEHIQVGTKLVTP